jgi:hypothetical protein
MQRWRKNDREGRRIVRVPIRADILHWLAWNYPGRCNLDDLADVGRFLGEILESSAACRSFYADRHGFVP